jgi:hypothetical protein
VHGFEKRSSYCHSVGRSRMSRLLRQIDLNAGSDCLGKRPFGARHRRFRRLCRAYRQDALPSRRMHVGAKPRPALRRNNGHIQPAMTTRPMLDHRVTGTKRKLRLGHVSAKHTAPPSPRYTQKTPRPWDRRMPSPVYPGSAAGYRAAPSRPGVTPSQRGPASQRVEAPWG